MKTRLSFAVSAESCEASVVLGHTLAGKPTLGMRTAADEYRAILKMARELMAEAVIRHNDTGFRVTIEPL